MRIATNHIKSIVKFFQDELAALYSKEEIENFIFFSFEHFLGFSQTDLILKAADTISESELLKFNDVVKRLKNEEPIQYILGEAWFYGLKFKVNSSVLIPRPETEELVDWIIKDARDSKPAPAGILDIGTGSGCIAVTLKKKLPGAELAAVDISPESLHTARENGKLNNVAVNFIQGDVFNFQSLDFGLSNSFDIIVSNPPYVLHSEKMDMKKNVLDHEPHLALFVDNNDPLLFYRVISEIARKKLNSNGKLYFEINEAKGKDIKSMLLEFGYRNIEIKKDISGKDRMIRAEL